MFYLIFDGKVVQKAEKSFPVAPDLKWIESDVDMDTSWRHDGVNFVAPVIEAINTDLLRAQAMPTDHEMIMALWDHVMNNDSATAQSLNQKIVSVDQQFTVETTNAIS